MPSRLLVLLLLGQAALLAAELPLRGTFTAHDPSTIVTNKGEYWVFSTGDGILSKHSRDLETWEPGPPVFANPPSWTTNVVPGFKGHFWAPDVIRLNGRYYLYYSVSTWGSQLSAIGLATNATLNPHEPAFGWHDCGIVIRSSPTNDFNAIDPNVMMDSSGKLWLTFGSYWTGIKLTQLDPLSGVRMEANSRIIPLAWKEQIEAACLWQHGDYFYLFVNWGHCCRGIQSTYNIRVGRSRTVTGPYIDKDGVDLLRGGGSLFLESEGPFIGPGHAGILIQGGKNLLSHHYYNGNNHGARTLGIRPLGWTADSWPEAQ